MKLNNKVYDALKWIVMIVLPAISALYFGLAKIWGFPYAAEVVGTIAVVQTFLGALIGVSTKSYEGDGELLIDASRVESGGKAIYRFDFDMEPTQVKDKHYYVLKVTPDADLSSDTES